MNNCLTGMAIEGAHSPILGLPRGFFFQILILAAFGLIMYWIFRNNKGKETAEDVLKKRYAAGEITKKEFLKIKKDID